MEVKDVFSNKQQQKLSFEFGEFGRKLHFYPDFLFWLAK